MREAEAQRVVQMEIEGGKKLEVVRFAKGVVDLE